MGDSITGKKHHAACLTAFQQAGEVALQTYGEQAVVLAGAIISKTLAHLHAIAPTVSLSAEEPSLREATQQAAMLFDSVGGLLFGVLERLSEADRLELNRRLRAPVKHQPCGCGEPVQ